MPIVSSLFSFLKKINWTEICFYQIGCLLCTIDGARVRERALYQNRTLPWNSDHWLFCIFFFLNAVCNRKSIGLLFLNSSAPWLHKLRAPLLGTHKWMRNNGVWLCPGRKWWKLRLWLMSCGWVPGREAVEWSTKMLILLAEIVGGSASAISYNMLSHHASNNAGWENLHI